MGLEVILAIEVFAIFGFDNWWKKNLLLGEKF
jgi:hypothetical protein